MNYARQKEKRSSGNNRLNILVAIVFLFGLILVGRLYQLQVLQFKDYEARASGQHQSESLIAAERGEIFIRDSAGDEGELYPLAANKELALVFAIPNAVENKNQAEKIANIFYAVFDEENVKKEVEDFFQNEDKNALQAELNAAASLPLEEKNKKQAEINNRYNVFHNDKYWLAIREEAKKQKMAERQKEILDSYYLPILNKGNDPYEPLQKKVPEEKLIKLYALLISEEKGETILPPDLYLQNGRVLRKIKKDGAETEEEIKPKNIYHSMENYRFYPENNAAAQILGFVRLENEGLKGSYGLEGFFDKELAGESGYLKSERGARRDIVILNDREYVKPKNGSDLVLTINRSVQFFACQKLKEAVAKHGADSGNIIAVDPKTGAIIAMCSVPDFDPNNYQAEKDLNIFNNTAIFEQYEPGSVFKAITMAAALNEGKVKPATLFNDLGQIKKKGWDRPIKNSDFETHGPHGWIDMSGILEYSLNTGAVFAREQVGAAKFVDYVRGFGFGDKTGLELEGESPGNISNITKKKAREIDLDMASFGQAIAVTPLQMAMSYAALANGGVLMKPYIVKEIIAENGEKEVIKPSQVRQVISEEAADLLTGMLVNVVEKGHAKGAQIDGYFIGGKTGTAQVPDKNGYSDKTIHTFIGIAPVDDPKFVVLAKINDPKDVDYAEGSVVPLFHEIADFMLKYYQVPKER